jgi:hypothetical protein
MTARDAGARGAEARGARLAVIGAGPIGLEMALVAGAAGYDVRVYEAGRVGESLRRFGEVSLFTPFEMNSTEVTRGRLRRAGVALPPDDTILKADSLVARYLGPIASLPELQGRIHESCRVAAIARDGRSFLLRVETPEGSRFEGADVVVDASGIVERPLASGPGGLAALGEDRLGTRVDRHLLPTRADARARFGGRRVLLIGAGHSAATALSEFDAMAREGAGPARVTWVNRGAPGETGAGAGPPFLEHGDDPLPERRALAHRANAIAARVPWLETLPARTILAYEAEADGSIRVRLREPGGGEQTIAVDRVFALVGYRPDTGLYRDLRVHLCYDTDAPMALAAALLAARAADPGRAPGQGDCLTQTTHGPDTLRTTEPGFYVIGAKSYGRAPDFLLRVGYQQAGEVAELLSRARSESALEGAV